MKKAVVFGVILLTLGSLAFADTGFSMWGRTQYVVAMQKGSGDVQSGWKGFVSTWPPAPRENLNWWFTSDMLEMHFTAYLDGYFGQTKTQTTVSVGSVSVGPLDTAQDVGGFKIQGVDGVLKLVPDMFTLHIGEYNADGWDTFRKTSPNPIRDVNNNNVGRFTGFGIIGDLAPKGTGFEAAVMWRTADPTSGSAITTFADQANNTDFGASYTVPDMVKVTAGSTVDLSDLTNFSRNLFARVELLSVKNLVLWADVRYQGWAAATSESDIFTELASSYTSGDLTVALAAQFNSVSQAYALRENPQISADAYTSWLAQVEVYYNTGAVTPGLWAKVAGNSVTDYGISYYFEPYVKINDFNLRVSFLYNGSSNSAVDSTWEIPVLVDFSF